MGLMLETNLQDLTQVLSYSPSIALVCLEEQTLGLTLLQQGLLFSPHCVGISRAASDKCCSRWGEYPHTSVDYR